MWFHRIRNAQFPFTILESIMPIYEYRCDSCGFQKEFIRRMSDPTLTDCPECKKATFSKMVTAAGFQLKGGGWYVTDFKNSGGAGGNKKIESKQEVKSGESSGATVSESSPSAKAESPSAKSEASGSPSTASSSSTSSSSSDSSDKSPSTTKAAPSGAS